MNAKISRIPHIKVEKNKRDLPSKPIVPATYPDYYDQQSNIPISSDLNVEFSKEWVDFNKK